MGLACMPSSETLDRAQEETLATRTARGTGRVDDLLTRGDVIDRYVVLEKVGHGGMGVVYSAYDPELNRRVAIKLLMPGQPANAADGGRLLREARAMAQLTHPHVVAVYDAGTHEGAVFLAMEFLDGGSLGTRMRTRQPWRTLLPPLIDAARGLGAAHAAGLVHRDFKPDNVMLTPEGVAKVSDFGLARIASRPEDTAPSDLPTPSDLPMPPDRVTDEFTHAGTIVGTPAYMAPEQHLGAPADARSDQFSFCVALYEALYGERPFRGPSMFELVESVTSGRIAEPADTSDVPAYLRRIVWRGLATDPAHRWPSMLALVAALQDDPRRRRTRRLVVAGVGASVLAVAGGMLAHDHRRREACRREGATLGAIWNDERREAISDAMRSTGVSYAETTVVRTGELVDEWTQRWAASRTSACMADADETNAAGVALRRSCLDQRREHLAVVLDGLEQADVEGVATAVATVAALPRIEPCDDVRWLERQRGDVAASDDTEAVSEIARLGALTRTDRVEPGLALARELDARTTGDPVRRAEVLRWRGLLESSAGDPAVGVESLRRAYFLAGHHRADRIAALAACDLVMLFGVRIGDIAVGREWAEHATMMTEREPDPELQLELLYAVGALETSAYNTEAGIASFREQVDMSSKLYGPEHPETGYARLALSNALSTAGRYAEARTELELSSAIHAASYGATHPAVAAAKYNLGNLSFHEGNLLQSIALHREALTMREAVLPPGHADIAASYSTLGSVTAESGDVITGLGHHRRAHAMLVALYGEDSPNVIGDLYNVVQDLVLLRRFDEAATEVERLCAHAEHNREATPRAWVQCLEQRTLVALGRGDEAQAVSHAEAAAAAGAALYGPNHPETASIIHNLGQALIIAGERRRGCEQVRRAVAIWRESLDEDHRSIRDSLATIARDCSDAG